MDMDTKYSRVWGKGFVKGKGDMLAISPERFNQHSIKYYLPWDLLKKEILGYCVYKNYYWLLVCEESGEHSAKYARVPFSRNKEWFLALTSEPEFKAIRKLPQIYITGIA
jgi:hypothetical protein